MISMPTSESGATTTEAPLVIVNQHYADVDQGQPLADFGLNAQYISSFLSAMITQERCNRHLYKSIGGRTNNPYLKLKYEECSASTETQISLLSEILDASSISVNYVSPFARVTEKCASSLLESTYLLEGSVDLLDQEMVLLNAAITALSKSHNNWQTLARLANEFPPDTTREIARSSTEQVIAQKRDELDQLLESQIKLTVIQAKSALLTGIEGKGLEAISTIRKWFL